MTCLQKVPDTHKRRAASRPDMVQNFVYTPHASELTLDNPHRGKHVQYVPLTVAALMFIIMPSPTLSLVRPAPLRFSELLPTRIYCVALARACSFGTPQ